VGLVGGIFLLTGLFAFYGGSKRGVFTSESVVRESIDSQHPSLGPVGAGEWSLQSANAARLKLDELNAASLNLLESLPHRACTLVVKDGAIVHEKYYDEYSSSSMVDSSAIGMALTSLIIGRAATMGLLNIDQPLKKYGVKPIKEAPWRHHFDSLTARHLLGQASGLGKSEPGSTFSYDHRGAHLQLLSELIGKVAGGKKSAVGWAKLNLLDKIGIGDFYKYDEMDHGNFRASGGQMATCRDIARIGQFILNGGVWSSGPDGKPERLITEAFMDLMAKPAFPEVAQSYGFLSWVNQGPSKPGKGCCRMNLCYKRAALKAGDSEGDRSLLLDTTVTDLTEPLVPGAPGRMIAMVGAPGKAMMVLPDQGILLMSLGNTWAEPKSCSSDFSGSDDGLALRELWKAYSPAIALGVDRAEMWRRVRVGAEGEAPQPAHMLVHPVGESAGSVGEEDPRDWNDVLVEEELPPMPPPVKASLVEVEPSPMVLGSVRCDCSPHGVGGRCFEITRDNVGSARYPKSLSDTATPDLNAFDIGAIEKRHIKLGADFCPNLGLLRACVPNSREVCKTPPMMVERAEADVFRVAPSPFTCVMAAGCTEGASTHQRCDCTATAFQTCKFEAHKPCGHSPHYLSHSLGGHGYANTLKCARAKAAAGWCY